MSFPSLKDQQPPLFSKGVYSFTLSTVLAKRQLKPQGVVALMVMMSTEN